MQGSWGWFHVDGLSCAQPEEITQQWNEVLPSFWETIPWSHPKFQSASLLVIPPEFPLVLHYRTLFLVFKLKKKKCFPSTTSLGESHLFKLQSQGFAPKKCGCLPLLNQCADQPSQISLSYIFLIPGFQVPILGIGEFSCSVSIMEIGIFLFIFLDFWNFWSCFTRGVVWLEIE